MCRDGPYRALMGPQLGEHRCCGPRAAAARKPADRPPLRHRRRVRAITRRCAEVGWPDTIATLLGFIRPWRRQLAVTVSCGIGAWLRLHRRGLYSAR